MESRIAVIGAGSWGTTVAMLASRARPTKLWARDASLVQSMDSQRANPRYVSDCHFPEAMQVTANLEEATRGASIIFLGVPSHGARAVLEQLAPLVSPGVGIVSLAKGLEQGSLLRITEVIEDCVPHGVPAVLTGPNIAHEIAVGQPAGSVVACGDVETSQRVQSVFEGSNLRVYTSLDVAGCEIAGVTKNVLAIASGIVDGLGLGDNARAMLLTRGLAEMSRLGLAAGGDSQTFGGLAGVGDLMVTSMSAQSRNRRVGMELGAGRDLARIVAETPMIAEGVQSAAPLVSLAGRLAVELPIAERVLDIIEGRLSPEQAVRQLMDRPVRGEWDALGDLGLSNEQGHNTVRAESKRSL